MKRNRWILNIVYSAMYSFADGNLFPFFYLIKCKCAHAVRRQLHRVQHGHLDHSVRFCSANRPVLVTLYLFTTKEAQSEQISILNNDTLNQSAAAQQWASERPLVGHRGSVGCGQMVGTFLSLT